MKPYEPHKNPKHLFSLCIKIPRFPLLEGSWDLVSRVIGKVPTVIITYNPN